MPSINLKLKTPNDERNVEVEGSGSVKDLKAVAANAFEVPEDKVCLIYSGKILQDEQSLESNKIKDSVTVHLVIRNPRPVNPSPAGVTATSGGQVQSPGSRPATTNQSGGAGLQNFINASGTANGFSGMQRALQSQIMQNPEMMNELMDNPITQSLMNNPEMMRSLIESNPQVRGVVERNPELGRMISDPQILRQAMEVMRNPTMMQEMVRNYDRVVSNIEAIPGGMNHLQRIYQDIQEPLMAGDPNANPFADNATGATPAAPTDGPMPNPWAPTTGSTPTANTTADPLTNAMGNPAGLAAAMNQPYMRQMMEAVASNPQLMQELITQSPLTRNMDAGTRETMLNMMPQISQQMSQPEFQRVMTNPRAMQAIMQINEGMQTLQEEVPEYMNIFRGNFSFPATGAATTTPATTGTNNTSQGAPAAQPELGNLLASMMNVLSTGQQGNTQLPPEQRYEAQLTQMAAMGFLDREANIRALMATFGDVNAAIDRLLSHGN